MYGKKTDNPPGPTSWRERIEDLDVLPGTDGASWKEAAWERLYPRLGQVPARRGAWTFAAACLALAAIASVLTGRPVPEATAPTSAASVSAPVLPDRAGVLHLAPSPATPVHPARAWVAPARIAPGVSGPGPLSHPAGADPALATLAPADSPATARTAFVPVRRELPVVHINELGLPAGDSGDYRYAGKHRAWFRLPLHLLYPAVGTPDPDGHTADNSNKINIPLQH